jgi:hypothetical protein
MPQRASLQWWKENRLVLTIGALAVVIATIAVLAYWAGASGRGQGWAWTGLVDIKGYPKKTFWDWLELLIIPIVLAFGAFWLNTQTRKSEQALAQDRARENALQRYLDSMQELILDKGLGRSEKDVEIRAVARARTLTVLRSLDGKRKGQVVRFLYEADLLGWEPQETEPIIKLHGADLRGAKHGRPAR